MQTIQLKFDSKNPNWTGDRTYDRMFLSSMGQHINDTIKLRGYIYLNQIYELLGCKWDPDDRNTCVRTRVEGKLPFVHIGAFYEPDGTLSAIDITLDYC